MSFIVAVAENGVIGRDGSLPWRLSSDLKLFRRLTMGKPLIMGRKTWDSLGRPLDGRDNIVVTRDALFGPEGAIPASSPEAAMEAARKCAAARGVDEIMVIGGAGLFSALMNAADRIYWTDVHASVAGDVVFPPFAQADWIEVSREALPRGEKDQYSATLRVLERAKVNR